MSRLKEYLEQLYSHTKITRVIDELKAMFPNRVSSDPRIENDELYFGIKNSNGNEKIFSVTYGKSTHDDMDVYVLTVPGDIRFEMLTSKDIIDEVKKYVR